MTVEKKIVEGCIAGKRSAQNQLYKQYAGGMLGVCLRYSNNLVEAEDILQDGFIKVFKYIESYRFEGSIEGWIRKIIINTAITHINKKKRLQFTDLDESKIEIADTTEDIITNDSIDPEILLKFLQNLPEGYRTVINLYIFEGYNHREIGEILGISENTSKSQLSKARKTLVKKINDYNLIESRVTNR
jgi:RNA polymerase sigma-70 factor (ECF subfamily)